MRNLLSLPGILLALLISFVLSGCDATARDPSAAVPIGARVAIIGNPLGNPDSLFRPERVRVRAGQAVTWTVIDDQRHTVTPDVSSPGWSAGSDVLKTGSVFTVRFIRPGIYRYYCTVHPNMLGIVEVRR